MRPARSCRQTDVDRTQIDEITNLGAVNIRLRSLFAALEERDEAAEEKAAPKAEA